jgi:hypothetical protein
MKRLKKIVLMPVKQISYRMRFFRLYYWTEITLYPLQAVSVLPRCYYNLLYRLCIRLVEFKKLKRLANRAIHTIPYHIRFEIA